MAVSDHEKDEELIINPLMYANGHERSHHEALKANVIKGIDENYYLSKRSDESNK